MVISHRAFVACALMLVCEVKCVPSLMGKGRVAYVCTRMYELSLWNPCELSSNEMYNVTMLLHFTY